MSSVYGVPIVYVYLRTTMIHQGIRIRVRLSISTDKLSLIATREIITYLYDFVRLCRTT
jgi:hypothetical protein